MTKEEILQDLKNTNALLEGHFLLSSGLHSDRYFQCALLLQRPKIAEKYGKAIAELYKSENITCVIGPALGGVTIAYEVGRALGVRAIFSERVNGEMKIRRGFSVTPDDKVLIVEDVITTGGSVKEVYNLLKDQNINVAGIASIVDRSGGKAEFEVPYKSLLTINVNTYQPKSCPLCKEGTSAVKPGSRK